MAESIIKSASLEYVIDIKSYLGEQVILKKNNEINFRIRYDASFLGNKAKHHMSNFRFLIIDGYVESVGEIYHFLHQAAETKVPYVIFCFGMSPEVKNVIQQNNSKGITEIMPVCFSFQEETINILKDIAVV